MKNEVYLVGGMSCAACSASVQRVVSRLNGVAIAHMNGILRRSLVPFPEILKILDEQ